MAGAADHAEKGRKERDAEGMYLEQRKRMGGKPGESGKA